MQRHNLIKEYHESIQKTNQLRSEMDAYFKQRAQSLRQFNDEEIVDVFAEGGRFLCKGIVTGVFIFPVESWNLKDFANNEEMWIEHINNIRYRVNALKKDGTKSSRAACGVRSMAAKSEKNRNYYIVKSKLSHLFNRKSFGCFKAIDKVY